MKGQSRLLPPCPLDHTFDSDPAKPAPEQAPPSAGLHIVADIVLGIGAGHHLFGDLVLLAADQALDLGHHFGMILEERLGVLAALADAHRIMAEPTAGLLDNACLDAEIENLADLRNALAIHDVEFDLLERRRDLVLDDLHARGVADDIVAVLDLAGAADVETHRGVEFQRIAAGGGFRVAVHHADLHAQLVDEDDHAARAADRTGELAQRLAPHSPHFPHSPHLFSLTQGERGKIKFIPFPFFL